MNCLKCGKDIAEEQVFCPDCLEVMKKYPVKPGTAVQLPHRTETPAVKKVHVKRRQPPTPEEQVKTLRKRLRRFIVLWLVTLMLFLATLYPTVKYFFGETVRLPGQNYSTFTDNTQP